MRRLDSDLALVPPSSTQSSTDRDAVLATVQIFFDTMTARDVEGARKVMVAEGRFYAMDMRKPKSDPQSFSNEAALCAAAEITIYEPRTDLESGGARARTDCARCGRRMSSGSTASIATAASMHSI